jgi:acetamidase/formamidase
MNTGTIATKVGKTYELTDEGNLHYRFDNSLEPRLTVDSGDIVRIKCREGSDGQLTPDTKVEELATVDWERIHALTGPIHITGAEPGDTLKVEILDFENEGWGWTAIFPGFGILSDDFGDEWAYHIWRTGDDGRAEFKPGIRVPVEEFMGIMAVAPAEPGIHMSMPPRDVGGNIDIRHLIKGSAAYFPVAVDGALFSIGDGHLAQGDGEICGIAIEAPLTVTCKFTLIKGMTIPSVRCETRTPTTAKVDGMGYFVTSSAGPSLEENAQKAVRYMVDILEADYGLTRAEAYMLCSCAGDLKIAVPMLGEGLAANVTFHMPYSIFVGS